MSLPRLFDRALGWKAYVASLFGLWGAIYFLTGGGKPEDYFDTSGFMGDTTRAFLGEYGWFGAFLFALALLGAVFFREKFVRY